MALPYPACLGLLGVALALVTGDRPTALLFTLAGVILCLRTPGGVRGGGRGGA